VLVDTFGTGTVGEEKIAKLVREVFELKPAGIIQSLQLKRPIYRKTASYGHFGRVPDGPYFTWERTDKVDDLRSGAGLGRRAGS
jgi:S-adenosylmethionine synthetase